MGKPVPYEVILEMVSGSRLYGTHRPDSDYDIRGVCFPPIEAVLGLANFEQYQPGNGEDTVYYSLQKFVNLASQANPNIIEMLFAPEDKYLILTDVGRKLIEARYLFLSQRVVHTYCGYAYSQLSRIKGHRRWIVNPPDHQPMPQEYDAYTTSKGALAFPNDERKDAYKQKLEEWNQYQRWLAERNPARADLERRFGYDCKHAGHLVRLMVQVEDILRDGDFSATLTGSNLDMVKDVMAGGWSYDMLLSWAEDQEIRVREMAPLSKLPHKPDLKAIQKIVIEIMRQYVVNA